MKNLFLRIRLFFYELGIKIHNFLEWFKEKLKSDPWYMLALITVCGGLCLSVYEGWQYSKYTRAKETEKIINARADKRNALMDIHKAGPEKYLEEQLNCKNKAQVIKMFNNSAKYQYQYDAVIAHCKNFTKNSQYQKYLNPIISSILNGPLVGQDNTGLNFYNKMVDPNGDIATEGVMLILINSKDTKQVQQVKDLINSNPKYTVKVYDKNSPNGQTNFTNCLRAYLFSGEGERKGYDATNDWPGVAYAFNNNDFVWHEKELGNFPKSLPNKSLEKESIKKGYGTTNLNGDDD